MRITELVVLGVTTLALVLVTLPRRWGRAVLASGLTALVGAAAFHVWDGPRALMAPAYVVAFIVAVILVIRLFRFSDSSEQPRKVPLTKGRRRLRTARRVCVVLLAVLALVVAGGGASVFPVFSLPDPSGEYAVGVRSEHLEDSSRAEPLSQDPADHREIPATIWYPVDKETLTGRASAPYPSDLPKIMQRTSGIPVFLFDYLSLIDTHTYPGAVPAAGEFPVIIYSPGFGSVRSDNISLVSDLVSHGYVVVGIDHAGTSGMVTTASGETISMPSDVESLSSTDLDGFVDERSEDVTFTLNEIESWARNPRDPLSASLDTSRVGVLGYSLGGATAAQALRDDPRFISGVNLDGQNYGSSASQGVPSPMLHLQQDLARVDPPRAQEMKEYRATTAQVRELSGGRVQVATVAGAVHTSFSDAAGLAPLVSRPGVSPERGWVITKAYTRDHFDHHLKGTDLTLLRQPSADYPEVTFD